MFGNLLIAMVITRRLLINPEFILIYIRTIPGNRDCPFCF